MGSLSSVAGSALGGLGGLSGGAGATALSYTSLKSKYNDFSFPLAYITANKKPLATTTGAPIVVNDIHVELTSGFEASIARFKIFNVFNTSTGSFRYEDLKSQIFMGAPVSISLGYAEATETVFVGFIAGVAFGYEPEDLPYIEVCAMDVKSIMMGGTYSYQLTAKTYGDAVREIFQRTGYEKLKASGGITNLSINDTPDKQGAGAAGGLGGGALGGMGGMSGAGAGGGKASTETIEMVAESDYEFVVKAAKKFNYEFFVDRGTVIFRKAKSVPGNLATIGVSSGILGFRAEYSLTGLVGNVEARAMNAADGKVISAKGTRTGTISTSGKAGELVGTATKVYIDPTITSQAQASARVDSLMEQMKYRLGSLDAECVGIPDLLPGRFVGVGGMGTPADNDFYITSVIHDFTPDGGFRTHIVGCAAELKTGQAGGLGQVSGGGLGSVGGALGSFL